DPRALFEEEAARKPTERRLARDVLVVGADQVTFHGPGADEAVEAPQRGVGLWGSLVAGHDGFLLASWSGRSHSEAGLALRWVLRALVKDCRGRIGRSRVCWPAARRGGCGSGPH